MSKFGYSDIPMCVYKQKSSRSVIDRLMNYLAENAHSLSPTQKVFPMSRRVDICVCIPICFANANANVNRNQKSVFKVRICK